MAVETQGLDEVVYRLLRPFGASQESADTEGEVVAACLRPVRKQQSGSVEMGE
jgi:hypothetical protein